MTNLKILAITFLISITTYSCVSIAEREKNTIEDIADGNYRFCSAPNPYPYEDRSDGHRWCFDFKKTGKKIIGNYSYRAPKDVPIMCIEGIVRNNIVNGAGFELSQYGQTKPELEIGQFERSQNTQFSFPFKKAYWDNFRRGGQGGNNLKVNYPSFAKLIEPEKPGYNYWVWIRYNSARLNLNGFEPGESALFYPFQKNEQCLD